MTFKKIILTILTLSIFTNPAQAGGFLYTRTSGAPTSWENPTSIPINPESGSCGDYSNSEMITMIEEVLANWTDIDEVNLGFDIQEGQIGEIDETNFSAAYYGSTSGVDNDYTPYNAIIFDDDGDIHESLYGCSDLGQYLGVSTITDANSNGDISRASFVMNCACFRETHTVTCSDGSDPCEDNGIAYTEQVMRAIFQHEMGHFLNLDHTPLYGNLFDDVNTANDDNVPLMYPFLENPDRDISPKQDDIIALATMYPSETFEDSYCTLTGTILDQAASANELQCAAINAINTDQTESVSFITGSTAPGTDLNSDGDLADYNTTTADYESTADRGQFTLRLKPNKTYQISLASINSAFTGTAQVNPCKNGQLPVCTDANLADCNDGDESTDCDACITDDILLTSSEYITLYRDSCVAGATIDVGTLTAVDSISLESAVNFNGGVVAGDDDDDSAESSGCQLILGSQNTGFQNLGLGFILGMSLIFRFFKRSRSL